MRSREVKGEREYSHDNKREERKKANQKERERKKAKERPRKTLTCVLKNIDGISVTGFGEILPLWRNIKSLWQFFEDSFIFLNDI